VKYKKELIGFIVSFLVTFMALKVWGMWGLGVAILILYFAGEHLDAKK